MQITDITTTHLFYPHARPIQDATIPDPPSWAGGRGNVFVHIHTDEGVEGLGVGLAYPGVRQIIDAQFRKLLVGKDPFNIEQIWDDMFWHIRGYGRKGIAIAAISAVDVGLWDLKAKALGLPVYKLLGPYQESVPIYGSGGWTNFDEQELVAEMVDYVELGIPRVKMKVGKDFGPLRTRGRSPPEGGPRRGRRRCRDLHRCQQRLQRKTGHLHGARIRGIQRRLV